MDNKKVAEQLIKIAKSLVAKRGFDVTIDGNSHSAIVYFKYYTSFTSESASDIQGMMNRFESRVGKIMNKVPVRQSSQVGDVRMNSQGYNKNTVQIHVSWSAKFKNEEEAMGVVDFLENHLDIGEFSNWLSL